METEQKEKMRGIINQAGLPKPVVRAAGVVRDKYGNIKGNPNVQPTPIEEATK